MNKPILLDTTVFIHYFRGRHAAAEYLDKLQSSINIENRLVSQITEAELYFGCNSDDQVTATTEFLQVEVPYQL